MLKKDLTGPALLEMADSFHEVQEKLERITLELKTATDPERRRTLLREMSRLLAEAERISGQPPKMSQKPGT